MFEKLNSITIKGGYFDEGANFKLFKDNAPLSILYGRNGSGKTTIARCIKQLAESDEERTRRLERISSGEDIAYSVTPNIIIPEANKGQVFVFDEDFLREQVRVEKDGLNTIVMLGEQVDLDDRIKSLSAKLAEITITRNKLAEARNGFDDPINTESPLFYFEKIRSKLREGDGWADVDCKLKGNRVKSKITDELVNRLLLMPDPKQSVKELQEELNILLTLFSQSEDAVPIVWEPKYSTSPDNITEVSALIKQVVEEPVLSERELRLLSFLSRHSEFYSLETTKELVEAKWDFCPLCFRETKEQDIAAIKETMTQILNDEAEVFNRALSSAMESYSIIDEDLPAFPAEFNREEIDAAKIARTNLNNDIEELRRRIELRKRFLYNSFEASFSEEEIESYHYHWLQYHQSLGKLETSVRVFNESVQKRGELVAMIHEKNDSLARKELEFFLQKLHLARIASNKNQQQLDSITEEQIRLEKEIEELKTQKERTDIALDYINQQLQYVFFSENKVTLIPGAGCYKLLVNGKPVKPKSISIGERNVLGLCYFFARLFNGKKDEDKYTSEYLIVIDDPVSSFDFGNRLGVMSLLRYQFNAIRKGNNNSRILVMSHDLSSVFDLVKIRSEFRGGQYGGKDFLELNNKQLMEQKVQNEYWKLLHRVYEYAMKQGEDDHDEILEMSIGNIMRRLLEAFSSFCYNTGFESMMCQEGVLKSIPDGKRAYYENLMCRLTLNGESHEAERVFSLSTITPYFSKEEKVQTAKSVLLFLFYVNEEHLKAYEPRMIDTIKGWQQEEAGWLPLG